jgi:hypothetical protein
MSCSSEADSEGGQWSAWVAAVVAQRGGEQDRRDQGVRRHGPLGVGDGRQVGQEVGCFGALERVGVGELDERGWDRG